MSPQPTMSGKSAKRHRCSGMTLVEVVIAMALFTMVSAGIYSAGLATLRLTQTNRLMAEAHTIAKQGIEAVVAAGYNPVRGGYVPPITNIVDTATHQVTIVRTTGVILHAANGSVITTPPGTMDGYAEIHVQASFAVPGSDRTAQTTLSTVLMKDPVVAP